MFDILKNSRNLLAFSGGVDSTALFFMLLENQIQFDIAIINYNTRDNSILEVEYAKELAIKYNKKVFIKSVKVTNSNFEKVARDIRYNFFEEIISIENYQNLLTAHQLNDKLEWFFMQLSKGAGAVELFGMDFIEQKQNYCIIRPLLSYTKDELIDFLHSKNIKYFIDSSNSDTKYLRNFFRSEFSDKFLKNYKDGVRESFEFLKKDIAILGENLVEFNYLNFYILKMAKEPILIRNIDKICKKLGILLSKNQKYEILKVKDVVVSGKIAITFWNEKVFIAPFVNIKLTKEYKEFCRLQGIPKKVRPYLQSVNFETKLK